MRIKEYSLREKKHAKTKIAIMNAFIKRLEKIRFDDISIREICESVEVSEGTFFNYFPEKIDIINYYRNLMFLKVVWNARRDAPPGEYVPLITAIFARMAEDLLNYNNIVYQVISLMIVQRERPKTVAISNLERQIFFPGCEGIENIPVMLIDDFLKECLAGAVKNEELPKDIKIDDVLVSLITILGGTLLAVKFTANKDRSYHYLRQLGFLWNGLRAKIVNLSIIALFTFNIVFAGYAQEGSILQIGLDETIKRALDTSEELKIKDSEVNKKQGVYREDLSDILPHISAQSTWIRNTAYPDTAVKTDYELSNGISVSQGIWSFGVMSAISSAKRSVEASRFNREAGREEIIYTAKLSYYSNLLAKNALSITEKSYANVLENKRLLEQRSYGGRSSKYEIIRMNAEAASRIPAVNEARTQFNAATETLKKIIDVGSDCEIELTGYFQEEYDELNYETLVAAMYEREPSLKSFSKTIESAEAKVKSKYAGFLPTLSGFTSWNYLGGSNEHPFLNNGELDSYAFAGLKVSIPIWEGGETEAQISQSKADKEIAVFRKKQLEKNLRLELKKAFLEYEQYKDNLKANIDAVNLSEESFKQTQNMFACGQVTLTDLNDAEFLFTNQRLNKEMTLFNINITMAKIEKLIAGGYDEDKVEQADKKF